MTSQKTVFITGAGSGIGATAAKMFSGQGWFVGLYDINEAAVKSLADALGSNTRSGFIDVTDKESVNQAFLDFSRKTGGRLDAMINNAGLFQDCPFKDADPAFLDTMIRVNIDGVVNCARAAYPFLRNTPDSHLVNLGSVSAIYGVPNNAVYSATKFFVRGFTEALRIEWENDGIIVNTVMPAYVATPMTEGVDLSHLKNKAMLSAEEIAQAIYEAATTSGMYWILPKQARRLNSLIRKMPQSWVPAFARRAFFS